MRAVIGAHIGSPRPSSCPSPAKAGEGTRGINALIPNDALVPDELPGDAHLRIVAQGARRNRHGCLAREGRRGRGEDARTRAALVVRRDFEHTAEAHARRRQIGLGRAQSVTYRRIIKLGVNLILVAVAEADALKFVRALVDQAGRERARLVDGPDADREAIARLIATQLLRRAVSDRVGDIVINGSSATLRSSAHPWDRSPAP